jgi:prevent-host-death family protein
VTGCQGDGMTARQAEGQLLLPVVGEAPAVLVDLVEGGQAVLLTRAGLPAVVVIDLDSYREMEQLAEAAS